jgi:hypothetical protein
MLVPSNDDEAMSWLGVGGQMNRDDILKMAQEAGAFWELSETPEKDVAFLMRVVERVAAAERNRCILILERLHEQVGDRHNYYAHAAKVLKGEI